ncbi:hypothetical protein Tco_1406129, partial [Tanacetum coccineum]
MEQMTSICDMVGQYMQKKEEEKRIAEDQAAKYQYWKIPICYDDDDDEESSIPLKDIIIFELPPCVAVTPVLLTEKPVDSLIMGDKHLDTISATKSDEVIKSSVEELVPIPSESEGIPDKMCDVPLCDNLTPLEAFKEHSEIVVNSNDDSTSSDDDSPYGEDIDYVDASPPYSELVSLEVVEIVIPEVGGIDTDILLTIKDDILREKLLNVNLLIAKIEALKDNPTPSSDVMTKSSSTSPNFFLEEANTLSLPDYEAFYLDDDHVEEKSSGNTTTHADFSQYDSFNFDLSINPCPPADRSDYYHEEFTDELAHIISPSEYDCFYFKNEPDQGNFTMDVVEDIFDNPTREPRVHVPNVLPTHPTLHLDSDFTLSSDSLRSDLVVSFPFGTRNKIFDPGIFIGVQSMIFLSPDKFSFLFIRDPPLPVIDTLLPFSSKNENKVVNTSILASKEKSPPSSLHWGFKASKLSHHKSPMLIHGDNTPNLGRPFLCTTRALVDLYEEKLTLRVGNEEVVDKPISGSTTFPSDSSPSSPLVETSDSLFEEFANELAFLDPFPPGNEEDNFDPEADLREIKYLLNRDSSTVSSPTKDIDIIDSILERFTDEPTLVYSSPPGDDDDYLFDLKSDNNEWKKLFDSTLPKESSEIATLLSFPFGNEDKVFNPGILILGETQIFNGESKDKDFKMNISSETLFEDSNFLSLTSDRELLFFLELTVIETLLSFSSENEDN